MITVRAGSSAVGVCLLLLIGGCSREQQDWRSAEAADTIESYDQFIQRHPESELASQARTRVAQLGEERDWQRAGSADNVDAYREFLNEHPNGKWAQEARIRIENFSLGEQASAAAIAAGAGASATASAGGPAPAAPQHAASQSGGAPRGLASPGEAAAPAVARTSAMVAAVPMPPVPAPAAAKPVASAAVGYGVQLGAFKTEARANSEWHALTARFGSELAGLQEHVVAADTASGRIYRLQASVGDQGRARALCESLRKQSQACVAVLPH